MVATSQSPARGGSAPGGTAGGNVERPKLRDDLLAEAIEEGGQKFVDVGDPDGNIFRFYEVEFSLACAMDGERDVKAIGDWAKDELGLMPSLNEIRNVIKTLNDLGYLDTGVAAEASKPVEAAKPIEAAKPVEAAKPAPVEVAKAPSQPTAGAKPAVAAPVAKAPEVDKSGLAAGVTVGAKPASAPAEDVELGRAGTTPASTAAVTPKAADIALGAPGAAATIKPPKIPVEDVALGNAGATKDVSLDLADHIAVSTGDVKEAVRASKIMQAVDVPKDLLDAIDDKKPVEAPVAAKAVEPVVAKPEPVVAKPEPVVAKVEPAKKTEPTPQPQQQQGKGKKGKDKGKNKGGQSEKIEPVVAKAEPAKVEPKKAEPAKVADKPLDTKASDKSKDKKDVALAKKDEKKPTAPPAPAAKTSRALVYLLILVVLAAGAFAYYWFVMRPKAVTTSQVEPAPVNPTQPPPPDPGSSSSVAVGSGNPTAETPPPTPPPLPDPKSKIAIKAPPPTPITTVFSGTLDQFAPTGLAVKRGNKIGRLVGYKPSDTALKAAQKDLDAITPKALAAAKARDDARTGDPAELKKREDELLAINTTVNEINLKLNEAREERSKFDIVAPADGKLNGTAKVGMDVTNTTILGTIDGDPLPLIEFDVPDELRVDVGTSQAINIAGKEATCAVFASEPGKLTLACPATGDNAGIIVDGAEATWHNPNTPQD